MLKTIAMIICSTVVIYGAANFVSNRVDSTDAKQTIMVAGGLICAIVGLMIGLLTTP